MNSLYSTKRDAATALEPGMASAPHPFRKEGVGDQLPKLVKRPSPRADINQEVRAGDALDSTSLIVEFQSESDHAFSR